MALPEVQINVQDPGLGIVPASAGKTQVKLGVAQKPAPNTVLSFGSIRAAKELLHAGPLLEASAQVLGVAGGPVLAVAITPTSYGTVTGSFSLAGSGTGTVVGSKGPEQVVKVKIGTGGTPGTMTFQIAIGSGAYGALITSTADPYSLRVPGQQLTQLVFANDTYVAGDIYTLNLDGTVTRTGTGEVDSLDGSLHSPVDAYDIRVRISVGGGLGAGSFLYSLDGGNNYSAAIQIPAGGVYVIPDTGIVLTFANTFVADDVYTGTATAAGFSNSDVTAAFTALLANPSEWGLAHVVGTPANAAAALTLASTVGAQMLAAETAFRYVRGIIECPDGEGDSTLQTTFASFVDRRVGVATGDVQLTSLTTGRSEKRNLAWAYLAKLSATKLSTHPGQVASDNGGGALQNVTSIYRDESATPALDAARFVTARTLTGARGAFVTNGNMMAPGGSDFSEIMNGRVMDRACTVIRAALLLFLNKDLQLNGETGFIDEIQARRIEGTVHAQLEAALLAEDEASAVSFTVARDDNLLSTSTLNTEADIIPKAYAKTIKAAIGFRNPVLAAT